MGERRAPSSIRTHGGHHLRGENRRPSCRGSRKGRDTAEAFGLVDKGLVTSCLISSRPNVGGFFYANRGLQVLTSFLERPEVQQEPLFIEDIYEAVRTVSMALGGTKKAGALLKPDLPADKAGEWLANCLNRARPEKLDPEQLMFLAREGRRVGCHAIASFMCQDGGYAPPNPIEPEDERAALQRAYIESVRAQRQIADRLEKLGGGS